MTRRLVISALPGEVRAALLDDDVLSDLVIQRADQPSQLGNLYLGRVTKVDRGNEAAFLDLGLEQPGFLPLTEGPGGGLSEGDAVTVRVLREAAPGKGLRLTAKLKNPPADLAERLKGKHPPILIQVGDDPVERLLAQDGPTREILVDDSALYNRLRQHLSSDLECGRVALERYRGAASLFEIQGLEEKIDALLEPFVPLPKGASLLIEPVTTLTAIDVNSGGADQTSYQINLAACQEIIRQLRLRALSGLVVVDFLELKQAAERKALVAALRRGLKSDPEPAWVQAMSASGLVEMTRRRGRQTLYEVLTEPCGLGGQGRVKSPATLAYEALHRAPGVAAARPGAAVTIAASDRVIATLQGPLSEAKAAIEARLGQALSLKTTTVPPGEAADVTLP